MADPNFPFVGDLPGIQRLLQDLRSLGDLSEHTAVVRADLDDFPFEGQLHRRFQQRAQEAHDQGRRIEQHRQDLLSLLPNAIGQLEHDLQDFLRQHGPSGPA